MRYFFASFETNYIKEIQSGLFDWGLKLHADGEK